MNMHGAETMCSTSMSVSAYRCCCASVPARWLTLNTSHQRASLLVSLRVRGRPDVSQLTLRA